MYSVAMQDMWEYSGMPTASLKQYKGDIMSYLGERELQSIEAAENVAPEAGGKSTLISRNITVVGRRTSVRLEPEMWSALREIARREDCKIHDLCSLIHLRKNPDTSLTAAIRVFLMLYYRAAATEEGHRRAGHGNFDNMIQRARMPMELGAWKKSRRRPDQAQDINVMSDATTVGQA